VVQFDDAVLEACGPELRAELLTEAAMLAEAFAPEGSAEQLKSMASDLASGAWGGNIERTRARRLASALRCLAREAEA
jgi:hypothetical protein